MNFMQLRNSDVPLKYLIEHYKTEDISLLERNMYNIFFLPLMNIDRAIKAADEYYNSNNNIGYIEQVMKDSVDIISYHRNDQKILTAFKEDLNFAKSTALQLFNKNTENMDIFALYAIDIEVFKNLGSNFINYIKSDKNKISLKSLISLKDLHDTCDFLLHLLTMRIKEMDMIQVATLEILNNIHYVQERLQENDSSNFE